MTAVLSRPLPPHSPPAPRGRRFARARRGAGLALMVVPLLLFWASGAPSRARAEPAALDLHDTSRLRVGVGDRIGLERNGQWTSTLSEAKRLGLRLDLLEFWLTRDWEASWLPRKEFRRLDEAGVTPVVIHYFFGDGISRERVERDRKHWHSSLRRMARRLRADFPVLVILEPEWNDTPPAGESAVTSWPGFADELREATTIVRDLAPNALIGTCPGDFPGTPNLEPVLGRVADDLDFLAFQEMRARGDSGADAADYLRVGQAAVDYARYLKRAFERPILLGYLAVSSHDGWEEPQRNALADLLARRRALREAGVWGVVYFQLYDDPKHRGYFGAAERHFGLLTAAGRKKPAFEIFRALTR